MGLRGVGKSTLGAALAPRLGGSFIDLDDITPAILGKSSPAACLTELGEPAFREAERRALDDPRVLSASVVSLGGGTPTAPGAAELLLRRARAGAHVIYLAASPATLRARLRRDDPSARPGLLGGTALDEVERLFTARDPIYRSIATSVVEANGDTALVLERVSWLVGASPNRPA